MSDYGFDKAKLAKCCGTFVNLYVKNYVEVHMSDEVLNEGWRMIRPISQTSQQAYVYMAFWAAGYAKAKEEIE